jgi:hypothetical protein
MGGCEWHPLIILQGLRPGPHKVRIVLVDANHHPVDQGLITFVVTEKIAAEQHHCRELRFTLLKIVAPLKDGHAARSEI